MSEELSDTELHEWMAFYRLEPFGDERADLRAGIVASTIANVNRGKRGRAKKPTDFMPYRTAAEQRRKALDRPDPKELSQKVRSIFGSMIAKKKV
ncbi:MAG: DUF4035 domain-containing protein [Proteobacteria bacterium]|nr:DUF4035 domain-containing protein [Pseudomonadota bacterium]